MILVLLVSLCYVRHSFFLDQFLNAQVHNSLTLVDLELPPLLHSSHWPPHQFSPQPCLHDTVHWSRLISMSVVMQHT